MTHSVSSKETKKGGMEGLRLLNIQARSPDLLVGVCAGGHRPCENGLQWMRGHEGMRYGCKGLRRVDRRPVKPTPVIIIQCYFVAGPGPDLIKGKVTEINIPFLHIYPAMWSVCDTIDADLAFLHTLLRSTFSDRFYNVFDRYY